MPESTRTINGDVRISLSSDRTVGAHSSVTPLDDQFHTGLSMNENNYTTQEGNVTGKHSYVTYHRQEETGGLIQTSVSPNKNHVTAISVNSPEEVLRSFRHEFKTSDTTRHPVPKEKRYERSVSVRTQDPHLKEKHYSSAENEVFHVKIAGRYENAASDTEIPVRYHSPHNDELRSNRHVFSDGGRIFEKNNENRSRKEREHATREEYLFPRHHSIDLSKQFYLTKRQKYPNVLSKGDYIYGHPGDYGNAYRSKDGHTYVRKYHKHIASHKSYPFAGQYSDTDNINDLQYSNFDVISLASSSDTDVFFAAESSDDNRKNAKHQNKFQRKYTVLSERDFKEPIPIYTHKHYLRDLAPIVRRRSTSRERPRRHSRARQVILSRRSHDSAESDDYDDRYDNLVGSSHARRSSNSLRQKRPDTLSLNRNDATSVNLNTVPYSLNTMPQSTIDTNFALYPYAALSPTFQNSYAGFPFSATSAYTNHLLRGNALDFATLRNYLGALSTSLASIPVPAIGTTPYISQQILQSNIPNRLERSETQDIFANTNLNYNITPIDGQVVYNNGIETKHSDKEATFHEGECLPVSSTSHVAGVRPSSSAGHLQGHVLEDTSGIKQGRYYNTDKHSQKVTEFNAFRSQTNTNRESSKSQSNPHTPTLVSGDAVGKTDKKAANNTDAEENESKFKVMQRQVSKELSARFQSIINAKDKCAKMSPVQSDSGQHRSPISIISPLPSVTEEPSVVSAVSGSDRCLVNKLISADNHSQPSKSPPQASLPKTKCPGERLAGAASPQPLQQPAFTDSSNSPVRAAAAHNVRNLITDDPPRSLGSNFFEISDLRVIDIQENLSRNCKHETRKGEITNHSKEFSALTERAGDKYSITQVCSHGTPTRQDMGHPEADYDVYPRKQASLQDKPAVVSNGIGSQPLASPTKVRFETPKPPEEGYNISVKQMVNKFSRNAVVSSAQNTTTSTSGESLLELSDRQQKTSNNVSKPMPYLGNQVITASPLLKSQVSRNTLKSYPSLTESTQEAHRSSYKYPSDNYTPTAHSAKSSQHYLNTSTQRSSYSLQLNDADTDFNDTPYQFYTGSFSLQPAPNNTNNSTPDTAVQTLLYNKPRNVFDEQFYNNTNKLRSDSINNKYIFYKGSITIPPATENSTAAVLNRTQQAPDYLDKDLTITNSEQKQPTFLDTKISHGETVHLETNKQRDIDGVSSRTFKLEVPIPPRDFDSDADSSEYIYTAKGWNHIPDKLSTANVMFCTGVEDDSAAIVRQLHMQTPKTQHTNESILEKFFRECLPKNQHCLSDTTIPRVERIFDWPFSDELSKSTVSLKWTSNMNFSHAQSSLKNPVFGDGHHGRGVNPGSSDLDSGVSLASQTSMLSVNDLIDGDRRSIDIPREDYSSTGSVTSCSSIKLGWDYLSWNDSVKKKEAERKHAPLIDL